jgi:hypothetical protein
MLCIYFYSLEHVTEDFPDLLKILEEKKSNMVHSELRKNKKKNGEVDIQVVTVGGEKPWEDFENGEGSREQAEGNIQKAPHSPLKFDATQQKYFLHDVQRDMKEERVCEELQYMTQRSLEEARVQEKVHRVTHRLLEEARIYEEVKRVTKRSLE